MILSNKQAHLLVTLLGSSLSMSVKGYLNMSHEVRLKLLNDIIDQQDDTPLDRNSEATVISVPCDS